MSRGQVIPVGLLAWVEKPLRDALEACQRVPMRQDEHRAWLAVFEALARAQKACGELHRLASWINETEGPPLAQKGAQLESRLVEARPSKRPAPEAVSPDGPETRTPPEVFLRRAGSVGVWQGASSTTGRSARRADVDLLTGAEVALDAVKLCRLSVFLPLFGAELSQRERVANQHVRQNHGRRDPPDRRGDNLPAHRTNKGQKSFHKRLTFRR